MSAAMFAYPFLFLSIFFESFLLVTLLSAPARQKRTRSISTATPSVAIIVPCWNESSTLAATTDSLLALDYPADKLEIILVDNNSTDDTAAVMARYASNAQVKILHELKRGKHNAVNAGIAATKADLIGCLDADSFVEPGALKEMIACFDSPTVAAATAAMSVHAPKNILQHMQNAEYIFGIAQKHALSTVRGIHVTPGPFSLYRRTVVESLGGFKSGYQTEDLEMALRLHKAGFEIDNAPKARVYTKAPSSVLLLIKQRTRWTSGYLRNVFNEYRSLIGNSKYGALGMIVLPLGITQVGAGIAMFLISMGLFAKNLIHNYQVSAGVPLSYSLAPHTFGWFYAPSSLYLLLAVLTILAALTMITIGKRLSKTPGSLGKGLIAYTLLYGLIAPLWLMRASADVALGVTRSWR